MTCETCQKELVIGDWPFCPHGKANSGIVTDDIPGGILIKHGICNPDGSPRKYYSKSEMAAEAKRRGLHNHVEHITPPGSDKSPHTQRFV